MKKILITGPFPKPISGVSLANKIVKEAVDKSNDLHPIVINTSLPFFEEAIGKFTIKKFLFYLSLNLKSFKIFKVKKVYITPGQTFFGVAKYSVFILLSFIFRKELVIHVHGNYLGAQYKLLKGFKKKYFYFLLTKFHKGIVLSSSLKNNLTPFLKKENIYILNNFAEDYLYKGNINKDFTNLKITYLSNLMEEKGILFFLESLQLLEKQKINYSAKIAGNIDVFLKDKILKKINKLENTEYVGIVNGLEKRKLLEWSNIFVLPTFYKMEGQPISILEALATENVIITTNHSGIPDIIKDNINGFIVKPKSADDLLEKFIFLKNNTNEIETISKKNKEYFLENFTLSKFESEVIKILNASSTIK